MIGALLVIIAIQAVAIFFILYNAARVRSDGKIAIKLNVQEGERPSVGFDLSQADLDLLRLKKRVILDVVEDLDPRK